MTPAPAVTAAAGLGTGAAKVGEGIVAVLVVVAVVAAVLVLRRWVLGSARGAFECSVRPVDQGGTAGVWRAGLARYEARTVAVFPVLSLSWWPSLVLQRERLELVDRRVARDDPSVPRTPWGPPIVVRLRAGSRLVDLALDDAAASGFSVWLESGPPGRGVNVS